MNNMPPAADTEADPGQSADEQMPDQTGQEQAVSLSLSKDEATQLLQLIASIGEQLDQQLKQMDEQGGAPGATGPGPGPEDMSNGMNPQAAALQQMIMARQKR